MALEKTGNSGFFLGNEAIITVAIHFWGFLFQYIVLVLLNTTGEERFLDIFE